MYTVSSCVLSAECRADAAPALSSDCTCSICCGFVVQHVAQQVESELYAVFSHLCGVLWRLRESRRWNGERDGVWRSYSACPLWCHWISSSTLSLASQRTTHTYRRFATLRGQNDRLGIPVSNLRLYLGIGYYLLVCYIKIPVARDRPMQRKLGNTTGRHSE